MAALSFNNNRRQKPTTATTWSTQRQQLFVRKQFSFIESGGSGFGGNSNFNSNHNALHISGHRGGRGALTRGLSVGRSYDGIRQKLNAPTVSLRHAGSQAYLQRQTTLDQDIKFKSNTKLKENFTKNSRAAVLNNSNTRQNYTRSNSNGDNCKLKQKSIVAWSSTSSLLKSFDDDNVGYLRKKNFANDVLGDKKINDTRKASTTTSNASNSHHQRSHALAKCEASKINLSIVLPQAVKTSIDETVFSDIESSLDSGVDTDTATSQPNKQAVSTKTKAPTSTKPLTTNQNSATNSSNNTAGYRRAQFRASRIDTTTTTINRTPTPTATPITTATTTTTSTVTTKDSTLQNLQIITTNAVNQTSSANAQTVATTVTTTATTANFSASPSLTVQRRPPLVRAMSAPVRPLDDSSKGAFAANKRKPRRRKIIARNISCDKTTEQEFLTTEIINGKKVLTRSRSAVSTDVVTLVSLMSSEGSDSEREDSTQNTPSTGNSTKSETSPVRRAPSLRKTGKSVSFQENYPPNFQLASKEYSHMIRRGSIAPLTARLRSNRPPTAPPVSIFLNMSNSAEAIATAKDRNSNTDTNQINDGDKRTPMSEKANTNNKEMSANSSSSADQNADYVFPDYVRSIKERECWKLYQKMCNKGVNVSYDTILRGMLTPTEFRQIQKQRELEEAKARELAEAENEDENIKPQSAIDRLSEALLKK